MNPIAVCLVGHEDWGKSETLYHLVGGSRQRKWIVINNLDVYVRHMSNDDKPDSFLDFINNATPSNKPKIVVPLCPNFMNAEAKTEYALNILRNKGYGIHFWVMQFKYGSSYGITQEEISALREYGGVEIYSLKNEAHERAIAFKDYLSGIFHA